MIPGARQGASASSISHSARAELGKSLLAGHDGRGWIHDADTFAVHEQWLDETTVIGVGR